MRVQVKEVSRGLSEQRVGVSAVQLNMLRDWHVCGATLFLLGPKNCQTANKDYGTSPGNDFKGMHSYDITPFHPTYVLKAYIVYTKNTGTIETPKLLSQVRTGLSLLF